MCSAVAQVGDGGEDRLGLDPTLHVARDLFFLAF